MGPLSVAQYVAQVSNNFKRKSTAGDKVRESYSEQHIARSLLTPDEVRNLPANAELPFLADNGLSLPGNCATTLTRSSGACSTRVDPESLL